MWISFQSRNEKATDYEKKWRNLFFPSQNCFFFSNVESYIDRAGPDSMFPFMLDIYFAYLSIETNKDDWEGEREREREPATSHGSQ